MPGAGIRTVAGGGQVVIALSGELDAEGAADAAAAVAAAGHRVVIDLSDLKFIDCCALGALLRVQQAARRRR